MGQSQTTMKARRAIHEADAKAGRGYYFHNALRKYGLNNVVWEILEKGIPIEELNDSEIWWIWYLGTFNSGYNLTKGGEGAKGVVRSEETRALMSQQAKGRKVSLECRVKISRTLMGRKVPPEIRVKMSKSHKGKRIPRGIVDKVAEANRGQKRTPEQIAKNREVHLGKKDSEETKAKKRANALRRWNSSEGFRPDRKKKSKTP